MATINVPVAARYGRNPEGDLAARNEWWSGQARNDADQAGVASGVNYANTQYNTDRGPQATEDPRFANNEASGAGGHQRGAIGLAGSLARGNMPSAAAYQLQSGLNQGIAQQRAIGRSARGSAALATADSNAGYNIANLQQNAFTHGGLLRSRDMAEGRGLLGSGLAQQRNQDTARIGMANEMSQFNAEQNDKYRLGMGHAAVGLGGVANAMGAQDLQYHQGGMGVVDAQSEADQMYRRWIADARKQAVNANRENE